MNTTTFIHCCCCYGYHFHQIKPENINNCHCCTHTFQSVLMLNNQNSKWNGNINGNTDFVIWSNMVSPHGILGSKTSNRLFQNSSNFGWHANLVWRFQCFSKIYCFNHCVRCALPWCILMVFLPYLNIILDIRRNYIC